jgi:hypothetical protein
MKILVDGKEIILNHGDSVLFDYEKHKDVEAKISIEYDDIYFCQNMMKGTECNNKFGYKYSWISYKDFKNIRLINDISNSILRNVDEFLFIYSIYDNIVFHSDSYKNLDGLNDGLNSNFDIKISHKNKFKDYKKITENIFNIDFQTFDVFKQLNLK